MRLQESDLPDNTFTPAALQQIHQASGGVFSLINIIAENALTEAGLKGVNSIETEDIRAVSRHMEGQSLEDKASTSTPNKVQLTASTKASTAASPARTKKNQAQSNVFSEVDEYKKGAPTRKIDPKITPEGTATTDEMRENNQSPATSVDHQQRRRLKLRNPRRKSRQQAPINRKTRNQRLKVEVHCHRCF